MTDDNPLETRLAIAAKNLVEAWEEFQRLRLRVPNDTRVTLHLTNASGREIHCGEEYPSIKPRIVQTTSRTIFP